LNDRNLALIYICKAAHEYMTFLI